MLKESLGIKEKVKKEIISGSREKEKGRISGNLNSLVLKTPMKKINKVNFDDIGKLRISKDTNLLSYVSLEEKKILLAIDKRLDQLDELDKKIARIEEKLKSGESKERKKRKSKERKKFLEDSQKQENKNKKMNTSSLKEFLENRKKTRENLMNEEESIKSVSSRIMDLDGKYNNN